jgi:predicted O-linked N-acetylglucosamine transferase (SPINDLY family)
MKVSEQEPAYQCLLQGDYDRAATLYEQAVAVQPEVKSHYWYLGLTLLLQEQAAQAQTTWLLAMLDGEPEQVEQWNEELIEVLETEALRQEALSEDSVALAIRQQILEICPADIHNGLGFIQLSIELDRCTPEELDQVTEALQAGEPEAVDFERLMQALKSVLKYAPLNPCSLQFAEACLAYIQDESQITTFLDIVLPVAIEIGYMKRQPEIAADYLKLGLRLTDSQPDLYCHLAGFYQNANRHEEGIETARTYYSRVEGLPDKIHANRMLMRGLMTAGGFWQEACAAFAQQETLLEQIIAEQPRNILPFQNSRLLSAFFFAPYMRDEPRQNRKIQNQVAQLCQANTELYARETLERYRQGHLKRKLLPKIEKPLKIGYLSYCLKSHSVGWLARWLFHYHEREKFQLHAYLITSLESSDSLEQWYIDRSDKVHKSQSSKILAEKIYEDEIDILIDLDSVTLDTSCEIVALKPAPIQVTWLGWDASGIPTIDYFIADPYVLPEKAQEYYQEKIWRLPQTYVAVDGFEAGVPTLRRDQLDIESDAIVYLSAQKGYKRHLDTVRLQMRILKSVPNSYFLIKGTSEEEALKASFFKIADEEGVSRNRLRFLPLVASEAIHRANLRIADVVLDTYPYNGATTTLETLWMGIPLVTRVGEQFSARNSYTMMLNAGITEGIARTDEEYVEWGTRLGTDAALRQQIVWKLHQSRQTAPLWNGRQFTREMEKAYEQMWARYLEEAS